MIIIMMEQETIKIQISEVEGMTIKIPTEFTATSFNDFYNQMQNIAKSMPANVLAVDPTPVRLKMSYWQDKKVCLEILNVWDVEGREATIKWLKENREMELTVEENQKLSALMGALRAKYKKELNK